MKPRRNRRYPGFIVCCAIAVQIFLGAKAQAEDGYRLWLRYDPLPARVAGGYRPRVTSVVVNGSSATLDALRAELISGCGGLLGRPIPAAGGVNQAGAVVAGTPESSPLIKRLGWETQLAQLGPEGFRIRSVK